MYGADGPTVASLWHALTSRWVGIPSGIEPCVKNSRMLTLFWVATTTLISIHIHVCHLLYKVSSGEVSRNMKSASIRIWLDQLAVLILQNQEDRFEQATTVCYKVD